MPNSENIAPKSMTNSEVQDDTSAMKPSEVPIPPSISGSGSGSSSSSSSSSRSGSKSQSARIKDIIRRIQHEKIPYIGIYKPGELGRETWRAVVPSPRRRGKGRGVRGGWESIVLSTPSRSGVARLIEEVKAIEDNGVGVRHIVNPHCNQDEGMRIVWPTDTDEGDDEMRDWSRRDRMIRDGKTVRPIVGINGEDGRRAMLDTLPLFSHPLPFPPLYMGFIPEQPPVPVWDNIGWTRLG